jgi:hypothetical protein
VWDADYRPNCVLRCQSEACYAEVYAEAELEPGEVDSARSRKYQTCLAKEKVARSRAERALRSKGGRR